MEEEQSPCADFLFAAVYKEDKHKAYYTDFWEEIRMLNGIVAVLMRGSESRVSFVKRVQDTMVFMDGYSPP